MARGKGGRVAMCVYRHGKLWWYRFTWNAEAIRESTNQTNKRVAEQIEAAHKTSLAKGEVGIRDRVTVPKLPEFIEQKFSLTSRRASSIKTIRWIIIERNQKPHWIPTARELQTR